MSVDCTLAYWLLNELRAEADSKYSEALDMEMELLESEDLLREALNDGRLQWKGGAE